MKRRDEVSRRRHAEFISLTRVSQIQPPLDENLRRAESFSLHRTTPFALQRSKSALDLTSRSRGGKNLQQHAAHPERRRQRACMQPARAAKRHQRVVARIMPPLN